MQLAVITDEISQDFEHALDVMLEYGVTAAELRGLWGTNIADLSDEQVKRAVQALQSRQMTVAGLATPFYKCDLPDSGLADQSKAGPMHLAHPRDFQVQMKLLQRCADLAQLFDTNLLRVFSFWRKAALNDEIEARIADSFAEPIELAERRGLTLILENEHACFIGSGAEAASILQRVNSPTLRACWDPGNAFSLGELPYPDGYEAIKPWITHIHVKDARNVLTEKHGEQVEWCVMGEGEIDYDGQFAALRAANYSGYLSLETHFVPEFGSGPEGKGVPEDSSRACLSYLRKLIPA